MHLQYLPQQSMQRRQITMLRSSYFHFLPPIPALGRGHVIRRCRNYRLCTSLFVCTVCRYAVGMPSGRALQALLFSFRLRQKKKRGRNIPSSSLIHANLFRFSGRKNLATIVGTAILASSVGQARFAAFRAGNNTGHGELPMRATSLIPSRLGNLTLRNSHE